MSARGRLLSRLNALRDVAVQIPLLTKQNRFLLNEIKSINERERHRLFGEDAIVDDDRRQTKDSFDFQWHEIPDGLSLPSDPSFMEGVESRICEFVDRPREWFSGKKIIDIGCGGGRFTYGLLKLGAMVTACDQSEWAVKRTSELCADYADRLSTIREDLLEWDSFDDYDLVFCYGVVHHTGNTYMAIRNVCRKVGPGGRVFLMVYGYPEDSSGFAYLNSYEALRKELRIVSLSERRKLLEERYGCFEAHGYFDATSPRINDLLDFDEITDFLGQVGFGNVKRTLQHRNHHLVADRI